MPHFEKMLYDNAQLIELMTEAWRETQVAALCAARRGDHRLAAARDGRLEGGGFAASLDADSEGEEGKFYVWSRAEIEEVLGEADASVFAEIYDVTAAGNFEGHNILNRLNAIVTKSKRPERIGSRSLAMSCGSSAPSPSMNTTMSASSAAIVAARQARP